MPTIPAPVATVLVVVACFIAIYLAGRKFKFRRVDEEVYGFDYDPFDHHYWGIIADNRDPGNFTIDTVLLAESLSTVRDHKEACLSALRATLILSNPSFADWAKGYTDRTPSSLHDLRQKQDFLDIGLLCFGVAITHFFHETFVGIGTATLDIEEAYGQALQALINIEELTTEDEIYLGTELVSTTFVELLDNAFNELRASQVALN